MKNIRVQVVIEQDDAGNWLGRISSKTITSKLRFAAPLLHAASLQSVEGARSFAARAFEAQAWLDAAQQPKPPRCYRCEQAISDAEYIREGLHTRHFACPAGSVCRS